MLSSKGSPQERANMKYNGIPIRTFSILTLLALSHIFANTITVGGFIATKRNFTVTQNYSFDCKRLRPLTELATILIDNNMSTFELVLEFSDLEGSANQIADVQLQEVSGCLGQGLIAPGETQLIHEIGSGRFIWKPGTQQSPTQGYQVRVLVTFKEAPTTPPQLTVSMPVYL
jgi:hypothetical protein